MSQDLAEKIRAAAQAKNIDPDIALAIAKAESSMRPSAQAKTSSASGLFQVVDSTWKEFGGNPKKKLDVDENIRVGTDIIAKNTQTLRNLLQRDPRPAEVYAAHYFGPSGARNFLTADPATPIVDILGKAVVRANPNLKGKTVSQVMAQLEKKMGSSSAPVQTDVLRKTLPPTSSAPTSAPQRLAGLGPGYQAAMALSFLAGSGGADTEDDEKEEERVSASRRAERSQGIAAQYLAQIEGAARPAAGGLFADVQIQSPFAPLDEAEQPEQPQMLADGGEVGDPYAQLMQDAPKRRVSLAEMGRGGLDTAAGMLKGATQAGIGTAGDIESLGRMLFGAKPDTFLPTTDETKKFIDRFAPLNLPADAGTDGRTAAEYFGEFASPAAAIRPLVRGAQAVGSGVMEGARQAERALEGPVTRTMERGGRAAEMLQALSAPPAAAIKPRGGTFAYTPDDLTRAKPISQLGKLIQEYGTEARDIGASDELRKFLKTKAPKYFTTVYGTADDPLRLALNKRRIEPFGKDVDNFKPYLIDSAARANDRGQMTAKIDLEKAYDNRTGVRAYAVKPEDSTFRFQTQMGEDIMAKMGEEGVTAEMRNMPDLNSFVPSEFELYPTSSAMLRRLMENQETLPPNLQRALGAGETMYDARPEMALLQPSSVIEALQEVPANKLKNMSFPEALIQGTQALAPVRDYLQAVTLAEKGAKVPRKALDMFTTPVIKAPSVNGQWVKIDKSVAAKMEGKLMNHSVGDYNSGDAYGMGQTLLPYGGKKAFDEGLVHVYSLRDADGLPKVTVEMAKSDAGKGKNWNVSQIRSRFNSEPPQETWNDIFRLLDKIDGQDGLKTIQENSYSKLATGDTAPFTKVDWGRKYDLYKQRAK